MLQSMYRTLCRSCTSEDLWIVVAEGQCANYHDLRGSAEPEVLGIPDLLHVSQALWRMPASKITVSFCRSSDGLSKDWGSRTCAAVLALLAPRRMVACNITVSFCTSLCNLHNWQWMNGNMNISISSPPPFLAMEVCWIAEIR